MATPSVALSAPHQTLPDTPAGRLTGELIHHVDTDSPAQIRKWLPSLLAASIDPDSRKDFVANMASAARDSGGLQIFDIRSNAHRPGFIQVAVKARRGDRHALFVLNVDPAHAGKLDQAMLWPMQDPALYAGWPKGAVSHAKLRRLIQRALNRLVHTEDFSGCLTVEDNDQTIFNACRGLAERSFAVPVNHQTRFRIASMGKMFTAVAIAQLVQVGKLSWNDTLAKRVPEYPDQATARKITVWELLHHTSGLGDYMVPAFFEHRERYVHPADYLGLIARQPIVSAPGKQWNYSNSGYVLLGRIIENASGESYFDYVQRHILAPAHMKSSGFSSLDQIIPKLATGYYHGALFSRAWKSNWLKLPYMAAPDGGGYSTNVDLLRFAKALRDGTLVKPATLAKMFDDEVPAGPGWNAAGFGDRLSHGRHIRGKVGGIEGTTADLQMVWETGATVVMTSNEGPSENWMLVERIADLLAAEGTRH
ncbi:serine hydrolase [Oleiagrimonas sp. MCCC 1A03011]|nr:serine hydrolase [Oleiagrimonas sp. MCCC 1A03011]